MRSKNNQYEKYGRSYRLQHAAYFKNYLEDYRRKNRVACGCGSFITRYSIRYHRMTKKHQQWMRETTLKAEMKKVEWLKQTEKYNNIKGDGILIYSLIFCLCFLGFLGYGIFISS